MKKEKMIEWFEQGSIAIPKLLLNNYSKLGLNESEFILIIHVHSYIESGNTFPTPHEIASKMTLPVNQCADLFRKLLQKGFMKIEDHESDGVRGERYSLQPLWEKILMLFLQETKDEDKETRRSLESKLYSIFESEFGRPLSPIEIETLSIWLDQENHDPVLIKAALRESVLSGKMNFRYIDRILFEWKRNGVTSVEKAQEFGQKVRQHQPSKLRQTQVKSGTFNWLDQE
ncbi:DNA replication protein [Bacillus mesophilus]|uniref:DnaD domain-containing protein n=1 Tax=Bacillus mesophilus TaxID=1808955 RepID=A0A6M0Q627_9BACI|nr:DnaD domain-containing protein [Bacillus mesophilus]MBM7661288.1 DNA replication protein [Bacillus mesophilus]NEY71189.1 DnaD domain-containing protein [Bacillus mesophilus]